MNANTVTQQERDQFFDFWSKQKEAVRGRVSEDTLEFMNLYTSPSGVGYEFGQLRPCKLGQWDLFWKLTGPQSQNICDENEAMIASGLTASEVAEEQRKEHYRAHNVNPDDKFAVAQFKLTQRMSPAELDSEIERLEKLIASA